MNSVSEIAKMIDHSLLHPILTDEELRQGCELARKYNVASVCIKPYAVKTAAEALKGSDVLVSTVIGFPHGNSRINVKVFEAEQACKDGAKELDIVVNIGKVLSEDWDYVETEIKLIIDIAKKYNVVNKIIFENDFLPDDKFKIKLCEICSELEVDYIKTSTGFGFVKERKGEYSYSGATDQDLILMREFSASKIKLKAAGKIRTLDDVLRVKALGVTRIGATATKAILEEAYKRFSD